MRTPARIVALVVAAFGLVWLPSPGAAQTTGRSP